MDENGDETFHELHFFYDVQSKPAFVEFEGEKYRYVYNLQGDVVGLVDASGNAVVEYKYDAWGDLAAITSQAEVGRINPFRYRGYVWDAELCFYYLQSRLYNPALCRFVNADSFLRAQDDVFGHNVFSYCDNNATNSYDEDGCAPQAAIDGMVHDRVLEDICNDTRYKDLCCHGTCIYYNQKNYWGGWGFCDLYNASTGEVWELKKDSNSRSCKTAKAQKQLEKYLSGRLKAYPNLVLKLPTSTIYKKSFSFTGFLDGYVYNVEYWSEGNGILRYSYTREKTELRQKSESIVKHVASLIVGVVIAGLTRDPSRIPAFGF